MGNYEDILEFYSQMIFKENLMIEWLNGINFNGYPIIRIGSWNFWLKIFFGTFLDTNCKYDALSLKLFLVQFFIVEPNFRLWSSRNVRYKCITLEHFHNIRKGMWVYSAYLIMTVIVVSNFVCWRKLWWIYGKVFCIDELLVFD